MGEGGDLKWLVDYMAAYVYANHGGIQTKNWVPVLCFSPLFSVVQLWNYTKTIIRLRPLAFFKLMASTWRRRSIETMNFLCIVFAIV